jgi:hypothetical protein
MNLFDVYLLTSSAYVSLSGFRGLLMFNAFRNGKSYRKIALSYFPNVRVRGFEIWTAEKDNRHTQNPCGLILEYKLYSRYRVQNKLLNVQSIECNSIPEKIYTYKTLKSCLSSYIPTLRPNLNHVEEVLKKTPVHLVKHDWSGKAWFDEYSGRISHSARPVALSAAWARRLPFTKTIGISALTLFLLITITEGPSYWSSKRTHTARLY